jgi:alkanesulfonate monooxygenase SsuD/methylene tetrahydromethanopterin reductase-like flavin-dependent oxidoreductase (luciferase family)
MAGEPIRLGVALWSQASTWAEMLDAARQIDRLGFDDLWVWDHLYAIYGEHHQPIFEGWAVLNAWAMATDRVRLGLLVGANTFRHPAVVAKAAVTLDHISNGRAIVGLGGAWFEPEHRDNGIAFGAGVGERLGWLDEAAAAVRLLLDGQAVTARPGGHYPFEGARHAPAPIQEHLPIMIGGGGEQRTLRTVARYADLWNIGGDPTELARKDRVLRERCVEVGRDTASIERTVSSSIVIRPTRAAAERVWARQMAHNDSVVRPAADTGDQRFLGPATYVADQLARYVGVGFRHLIFEQPAPYDIETLERLVGEVRPLLSQA